MDGPKTTVEIDDENIIIDDENIIQSETFNQDSDQKLFDSSDVMIEEYLFDSSVRGVLAFLPILDSSAVKAGVTYDPMCSMMNWWNHPFYDGEVLWRRNDSVWPLLVMKILPHETNQSVGEGEDGRPSPLMIEEID